MGGTCDPIFLRFPVINGHMGWGLGLIFNDSAPIDDPMEGGLLLPHFGPNIKPSTSYMGGGSHFSTFMMPAGN